MIDKIIFTRDTETIKLKDQLCFELPVGYKLYNPDSVYIKREGPTLIDFKIKLLSERPITLLFTETIQSTDFKIIDKVQIVAINTSTNLTISVINPNHNCDDWELEAGSLVATMVPVETMPVNLFEVSNKVYRKYV